VKPTIKESAFGSITVGKMTYRHDIVIGLDGKVRKRRKKLSKRLFGTSHKISLDEIQDVFESGASYLIIGTGHYDRARLSAEAESFLAARHCEVVLSATPKALKKWNKAKTQHRAVGLFHVTC
jgi:hypothetical protein